MSSSRRSARSRSGTPSWRPIRSTSTAYSGTERLARRGGQRSCSAGPGRRSASADENAGSGGLLRLTGRQGAGAVAGGLESGEERGSYLVVLELADRRG